MINMSSDRYTLFKRKGVVCVTCGLTGVFFAKERYNENKNKYHFNLYGFNTAGKEVMLTKDHIIPKCLGGKDSQANYQPMCAPCNQNKGSLENPQINTEGYRSTIIRKEQEKQIRKNLKEKNIYWMFDSKLFQSPKRDKLLYLTT